MKLNEITKPGYYQDTTNEKILFHILPDDSKGSKGTSNENKLVVETLECKEVDDNDRRIYKIVDDTFLYVEESEPIDVDKTDIKLIDYEVYDYIEDKPTYKELLLDIKKQIYLDIPVILGSDNLDKWDMVLYLKDYLRIIGEVDDE